MTTPRPSNRPAPGSQIRVEPIRYKKDIEAIKKLLADRPRDHALFIVGINTALRANELLALTVGQVRRLHPGDDLVVHQRKTKKNRRITLNRAVVKAIQRLLASQEYAADEALLFTGQRSRPGQPLTVSHLVRLVKSWCRVINLRGNYGSHTLRKTWGYHQRTRFGASLPVLMHAFGHSSQAITLEYLCIQPEEIGSLYTNEI
jgi:integrase